MLLQLKVKKWVAVSTQRHGLITLEPQKGLCLQHQGVSSAGNQHVNHDQLFKILIANVQKNPSGTLMNQNAGQVVAEEHPECIT